MAINVAVQVYRGTLASLSALATTGKAGVLAWTTDTNEIYVDAGAGNAGIGTGNAWQKVASDLVAVNAQTGTTYTVLSSDRSKAITLTNASAVAVTLPQAGASFPAGWIASFSNQGAGTVTITPTTSHINGVTSYTLPTGASVDIVSDGTNYFALGGNGGTTTFPVTAPVAHEFATGMNSNGVLSLAQPAFTDISSVLAQTQLPASIGSGSNLTSVDCGTF
jgi:hypothetical protein